MNLAVVSSGEEIRGRSRSPPWTRVCRIRPFLLWSLQHPQEVGTISSALGVTKMMLREKLLAQDHPELISVLSWNSDFGF